MSTRSIFKLPDGFEHSIITHNTPSWQKTTLPYTHEGVMRTQSLWTDSRNVLMVFDGKSGEFHSFNDPKVLNNNRGQTVNLMVAQSLLANFPERFHIGAPTFQILLSHDDYPTTNVKEVDFSSLSDGVDYAPVLQFGSTPRDEALLYPVPIKEMPFVKMVGCLIPRGATGIGGKCFYDESSMQKLMREPNNKRWEDLTSQIIWRGSDYTFLTRLGENYPGKGYNGKTNYDSEQSVFDSLMRKWDRLNPRWKAITLSLAADMEARQENAEPWIDAKFFVKNPTQINANFELFSKSGAAVATDEYLSYDEQMNYKYHIDLGGSGGTSWTGTLSKLAMPGVLFHHETISRDWFYDELQPWKHYIPVKMDLSDLREKYDWAEAHPDECQAMSEAATEFLVKMDTQQYYDETYAKYFVEHLGEVMNAYQPGSETLESIIHDYEVRGMALEKYSTCNAEGCLYHWDGHRYANDQVTEVI
uniref:Glycosyl transferase CAP10 domain-containing protein n=1 Tax=Helicotheca tamesis TaxID=374047 RepID=A0A6U0E7Y8_9STRA